MSLDRNTASIAKLTVGQIILRAIFPQSYPPPAAEEEGWAPGEIGTDIYAVISWGDRFRILISGKAVIRSRTQTDVIVKNARTRSTFSVLHPWAKR